MAPARSSLAARDARVARFLEPEVVSRLRNMELRARLVVEGFLQGMHRSPYHGFSVEFAEYRQYMPGDAPRYVDWKVYGKTDRYYVKVFEEETNLKGIILLDKSASMAFKGHGVSKFEWGSMLAASLGFLMLKQQDAAGLVLFDDAIREYVPPRSVRGQLHQILGTLERATPSDRTRLSTALHGMAERLRRRGLCIVISDLFDDTDAVIRGLEHFRYRQHEVVVFHVLDELERTFDFKDEAQFIDLETRAELRTQPWFLKKEYRARVEAWIAELARRCREHRIDYVPMSTATPFDRALLAYLNKRGRMG